MSDPVAALRARGFVGVRAVGDVHGEAEAFSAAVRGAAEAKLYVLQLGDLTDGGPDSAGALRIAFALREAGDGGFLLGNHDHKLRRALLGALRPEAIPPALADTLAQLEAAPDGQALKGRALEEIAAAPAWLRLGAWGFVHGAWHPAMLREAPPADAGARRPDPLVAHALFGEVVGQRRADGFPDRTYRWVDRLPAGLTVYCGHDRRSTDGMPFEQRGALGGRVVSLDLGAGKGGVLGWVDLPF